MSGSPKAIAAYLICVVAWGGSWAAIRIGLEHADPFWGATIRFSIAGILLLAYDAVFGSRRRLTRKGAALIVAVGTLLFGTHFGLVYWGETRVTTSVASILNATIPIFVALLAPVFVPRERILPRHWVGAGVALGGVVLTQWPQEAASSHVAGVAAMIGASLVFALSVLLIRRWGQDVPTPQLNGFAMIVGAGGLAILSRSQGETWNLPADAGWLGSLAWLIGISSLAAFGCYTWLLKRWPASRVATVGFVTPLLATAIGVMMFGEGPSLGIWIGGPLILLGVAISTLTGGRRAWPKPRPPPSPAARSMIARANPEAHVE